MTDDYDREIRFDVTVIEALTLRTQNISSSMKLFKYKHKLELVKTSDNFKPGLKYTAFLKVSYQVIHVLVVTKQSLKKVCV